MVVSKTQSGKTGSMCATIKKYLEDTSNLIPIENILLLGCQVVNGKNKQKKECLKAYKQEYFIDANHLIHLLMKLKINKILLSLWMKFRLLPKKVKLFTKHLRMLNKSKLYENDIKILEYTATPDGTIYDLMKWNNSSSKILADWNFSNKSIK